MSGEQETRNVTSFSGGFGAVTRAADAERQQIAELSDRMLSVTEELKTVRKTIIKHDEHVRGLITEITRVLKDMHGGMSRFINLSAAQMVSGEGNVRRMLRVHEERVKRFEAILNELRNAAVLRKNTRLNDVLQRLVGMTADISSCTTNAIDNIMASVPQSADVMQQFAGMVAGGRLFSVNNVGGWKLRTKKDDDENLDNVEAGIEESVSNFAAMLAEAESDDAPQVRADELVHKIQAAVADVERIARQFVNGENDAVALTELESALSSVVTSAHETLDAKPLKGVAMRFAEVELVARDALASLQNTRTDNGEVSLALDGLRTTLGQFIDVASYAFISLDDKIMAGVSAFSTRAQKLRAKRRGEMTQAEEDLALTAGDMKSTGIKTDALDNLVTHALSFNTLPGDAFARTAEVALNQQRRAGGYMDRLTSKRSTPLTREELDAAAKVLMKASSSQLALNELVDVRTQVLAAMEHGEAAGAINLTETSSKRLADSLTALLTTADKLGVDTPALRALRRRREQLIETGTKFTRAKEQFKKFTSALATVKSALGGAMKLIGTGFGVMGVGSIWHSLTSPTAFMGAIIRRNDELGRIRYTAAMAEANAGLDVDGATDAQMVTIGRNMFAASAGRIGLDVAAQQYAMMLTRVGGPRGGTAEQRRADAVYSAEQLTMLRQVAGIGDNTLQQAMKVFYHDAGESAQEATQRLLRMIDSAHSSGVPVDTMVSTITQLASSMRDFGVGADKVQGAMTALVRDRNLRIEEASGILKTTGAATASLGSNWGRSIFAHAAMGKPGSMWGTVRRNLLTHDSNYKPIEGHYDDMVDQMFAVMDVTVQAHGGYSTSTGLMMADKQLREMGYSKQSERSTILSSLAVGDRDKLKAALKATDESDGEALVNATQEFGGKLEGATQQLSAVDKALASYELMVTDVAMHVETVFGDDLEGIPGLVEKMMTSFTELVDGAIRYFGGVFSGNGLGAKWLNKFVEDPLSTAGGTLAVGGISLAALKSGTSYGLRRLLAGSGLPFLKNVKAVGGGRAALLALLAAAAIGGGVYALNRGGNAEEEDDDGEELSMVERALGVRKAHAAQRNSEGDKDNRSSHDAAQRRRAEWARKLESARRNEAKLLGESDQVYRDEAEEFDRVANELGISNQELVNLAKQSFTANGGDLEKADGVMRQAWLENFEKFVRIYGNIQTAANAATRRVSIDKQQFVTRAANEWDNNANVRGKWFQDLANKETDPVRKAEYNAIANLFYHVNDDASSDFWQQEAENLTALARGEGSQDEENERENWINRWNAWVKADGGQHSNSLGVATADEVRRMILWLAQSEASKQRNEYARTVGEENWRKAISFSADAGNLDIRTVRPYTVDAIYQALCRRRSDISREAVEKLVQAAVNNGIDPVFFAASIIKEGGSLYNLGNVEHDDGSGERFSEYASLEHGLDAAAKAWKQEIHRAGTGNMWKVANIYAPQHESAGNRSYVPDVANIMNEIYGQDLVVPGANPITPGENSWIIADDDTTETPQPWQIQARGGGGGAALPGGYDLLEQGYLQWKDRGWEGIVNGVEGCVESVTKMGAGYSPWLAKQLENKNWGVAGLAEQARQDNLLETYDASRPMQRGDVAIWLNEDGEFWHANIADGAGGYYNNSSSRYREEGRTHDFIEHFAPGEYSHSGNDVPAYVIRTGGGSLGGGGYFAGGAGGAGGGAQQKPPMTLDEDFAQRRAAYEAAAGGHTTTGVLVDNMRTARASDLDVLSSQLVGEEDAQQLRMTMLSGNDVDEEERRDFKKEVNAVVSTAKEYDPKATVVIDGEQQ